MYTSAVPELSSENTTPTPQKRKKKRDKSPFYSRDNMKRSEDLGALVAVSTQSNKCAALTSSHSSACLCHLQGWLLPAANEQSFVCVVSTGRCTAPSGTRHWLPPFTGLCYPGLHHPQGWLRAVLCWDGPGASCPFPRVFVRPAGRPLPSCSAPVGSDLLAGVAPGAPQSVKYWLLAGFEQNQWSC